MKTESAEQVKSFYIANSLFVGFDVDRKSSCREHRMKTESADKAESLYIAIIL
ncbi:hypothetical protein [Nostoc sp.]|uniref:hypothetical protein n=1 Tax=Nostoc sp. TaxID=1180 RepID=UPI002FF93A86